MPRLLSCSLERTSGFIGLESPVVVEAMDNTVDNYKDFDGQSLLQSVPRRMDKVKLRHSCLLLALGYKSLEFFKAASDKKLGYQLGN